MTVGIIRGVEITAQGLTVTRCENFPQVEEPLMVDSGTCKIEALYKSSAAFRETLSELEQLKLAKDQSKDVKGMSQEEIRLLNEEVALRAEYIETLLKQR